MQTLYAYHQSPDMDIEKAEKQLFKSIDKLYYLYLNCLQLILDITEQARKDIEQAKQKHLPTQDDLNPITKFINNQVIQQLENSSTIQLAIQKHNISWFSNDYDLLKTIFKTIKNSPEYNVYLKSSINAYVEDKKFIVDMIKKYINNSEALTSHFEEQDIYWSEDFFHVKELLIKTIQSFDINTTNNSNKLIRKYKDGVEDKLFIKELLHLTILKNQEYGEMIAENAKNWESERIAMLDKMLMKMAICEMINMPSIPIKVTLNEYIEISKMYSSPKSKFFINGILDKLIIDFKKDGKIIKTGRGLKDN